MAVDFTTRTHELLCAAWRQRYVVLLPILILPFMGLGVGLMSPQKFETHTTMLIQDTAKLNPFLEDLAVSSNLEERMAALNTLLHSRFILGEVVRDLELVNDQSSPTEHDYAVARLSSALSVQLSGKELIRISLKDSAPENMRALLETVSAHFVEQVLAPERSSLASSEVFLEEQLTSRAIDLAKAETSMALFKEEHADQLPELHTSNISRLRELRQRLAEKESELAGADRALASFDQQIARTNPLVGRLEEHIVTTRGALANLRVRYTDEHSLVLGAVRRLRGLEEERRRALETDSSPTGVERLWDLATTMARSEDSDARQPLLISQLEQLQLAKSRAEGLAEETKRLRELVADLEAEAAGYGKQEQRLSQLERDLRVKRKLYEDLLERRGNAQVTGSLGRFEQAERVKVIDAPFTPSAPTNPPLIMYILSGMFGGLALGVGVAVLLELLDTSIRGRDVLESISGAPLLSRIPALKPAGVEGVVGSNPEPNLATGVLP